MEKQIELPLVNEYGYFEIRLESIGGLGANLCGKLLGELGGIYLGLNSASFSSYGSEKRGSPVKAFVRWCSGDLEIRVNSPVEKPHILGIFHENMIGKENILAGVDKNTKIIVNTDQTPEKMAERLGLNTGELYCIDALKIAMEENTRVNMAMLGAIVKASGFIPMEAAEEMVRDTLGKKYPAIAEKNLKGLHRGSQEALFKKIEGTNQKQENRRKKEQDWGYLTAPIGGINPLFGSSVSNDLSGSREGFIPVFLKEKCINCGLCDTTCPDMVYQFVPGEYKGKPAMVNLGPDYKHCKGCLRCVEICPTHALVEGLERDYNVSEMHIRNQDLIVEEMEFDQVGANSWVTSDSFSKTVHVNEKEENK